MDERRRPQKKPRLTIDVSLEAIESQAADHAASRIVGLARDWGVRFSGPIPSRRFGFPSCATEAPARRTRLYDRRIRLRDIDRDFADALSALQMPGSVTIEIREMSQRPAAKRV